jgi:cytochrome c biogenesis protein
MVEKLAESPPEEATEPRGIGLVGWLRWAWRQLTSMRTALVLLFLLAVASVPGGLLPQRNQEPEKVTAYLQAHKQLGPLLDRLSLFDVFAAPWFAAIYLLLFVSLSGCVIPRAWKHFQMVKARPPKAPRHLARLPQSETYETDAAPQEVLEAARTLLRRRRFRVDLSAASVNAEKGHVGETGNLIFHLALLILLFAIGAGSAYGYKGNVLLTEGKGFSNSLNLYDTFKGGRAFTAGDLSPFTVKLDKFTATYVSSGEQKGMAKTFNAQVRYSEGSGREKSYDLKVNSPLNVGSAKIYLLGHGYAPTFTIRDGKGQVALTDSVPCLAVDTVNLTSECVIKAPDAQPTQLAFYGTFFPTGTTDKNGNAISSFPAAYNPVVSLIAFQGDLGLNNGEPQSVYALKGMGTKLFPVKDSSGKVVQKFLTPGQTFTLPNGYGSITFNGYQQWISLQITHDPGRVPALIAGIVAIAGIITSFLIRRRRVWVRASAGDEGVTVVEVGGLTLGNATSEFDEIVTELRDRPSRDPGVAWREAGAAFEEEE